MSTVSKRLLTEQQKAYVAGFFDGEGCVSVWRIRPHQDTYALSVFIGQVDPRPLQYIASLFGGKVTLHQRKETSKRRPMFYWRLCAGNAACFLLAILPYLINKRDQAELAIQFQFYYKGKEGEATEPDRERLRLVRTQTAERITDLKHKSFA